MLASQPEAAITQYIDRFSIADVAPLSHSNCEEFNRQARSPSCTGSSRLKVKKRAYLAEEVGVERPAP
jgi:hypothetical protein